MDWIWKHSWCSRKVFTVESVTICRYYWSHLATSLLFAFAKFWRINELSMRILLNRGLMDFTTRPRPTFPKHLFYHSWFLKELFLLMDEVRCKQVDWSPQCFLCTTCVHFFETPLLSMESQQIFLATDGKSQPQTLFNVGLVNKIEVAPKDAVIY